MSQTIKVYTTKVCPYCVQAKALLNSLKLPFEEISVQDDQELRAKLSRENGGWRTVPMIFVGSKFVGGYTDLKALHDKGQLLPLTQP